MQIYWPGIGRFSSRTIRKESPKTSPEESRETSPSRKNKSDPIERRGQDGVSGHRYNTRENISKALKIQRERRGSREEKEEREGKSPSEDILDPQISAGSSRNDISDQQERSTSSKPEEIKYETKPGEDSRGAEKSDQEWNMKRIYVNYICWVENTFW